MNTLYICCGPAGIGKSSWLRENADKISEGCSIVSRDEIRFSLVKPTESYFSRENEVIDTFHRVIAKALKYTDTFVDATNVTVGARRKLLFGIKQYTDYDFHIVAIDFYKNNMMEICLQQNACRAGRERVPDNIVEDMVGRYQRPSIKEGFEKVYHAIGNILVLREGVEE